MRSIKKMKPLDYIITGFVVFLAQASMIFGVLLVTENLFTKYSEQDITTFWEFTSYFFIGLGHFVATAVLVVTLITLFMIVGLSILEGELD